MLVTLLHLGALHPVERLLVLLVAFGPFLVLAVVVYVVRRRDLADEQQEEQHQEQQQEQQQQQEAARADRPADVPRREG